MEEPVDDIDTEKGWNYRVILPEEDETLLADPKLCVQRAIAGAVTDTRAKIWFQTTYPANVNVFYRPKSGEPILLWLLIRLLNGITIIPFIIPLPPIIDVYCYQYIPISSYSNKVILYVSLPSIYFVWFVQILEESGKSTLPIPSVPSPPTATSK